MKKRGLSLFLALALCLTLLPAAAFANGESETSTLHTHYLCGNGEACSHVGGHSEDSKTTFATAITQTESGYVYVGDGTQDQPYQCVLSEGTYYLDSDLVLKGPPNLKKFGCICIDSDVTLCLNGHTITIIDDRDAFDIRKSVESNPPTLTLTDCKNSGQITHGTTTGGTKYLGNGVSIHQSCNFIMYGGSITGNTTTGGENTTWRSGGVWVQDNSTFTMYGGSITDNTTVWNGGGVYVRGSGKFYMHGGEISGNNASSNSGSSGGGVHIGSGSAFTMTGGTISGNSASNSGGGVHIGSGSAFTMTDGSITGNNASSFGSGGVCVYGTMTVNGGVRITGNVNGGSKDDSGIYTGGTASNVRLVGRTTITIDGPLTEGSQIGVSLATTPTTAGPTTIATGASNYTVTDTDKAAFFSDEEGYSLIRIDNELKLKRPHTHSWTYTASGATITAKCNAADCTLADASGGSVTIAAPEADALTYDGSPKAAAVTTSGDWPGASADNIRITYKQGETTLPTAPTDAGIYTAGITVGEGGGAVTASVEYTIKKADLAAGDFTFTSPTDLTYNGSAKTATVTTAKTGVGTVTVTYFKGENQVAEPKEAGEYTVKLSVAASLNYNSSTDLTAENWKFTIAKAGSACTAPTPIAALTYTGEAQPLINAGTTADGTMQYSTDGTHYGTTIPTGENAGAYTVWYKVAGDGSHSDTTPASVSVTIAKAKVEIPAADPTQFTYSGKDRTYPLAASGLYTVAGNVRKSAGTHTVTVALKDTENYVWSDNTATAKTFDFVIAKAPVTVTVKGKSAYVGSTAPDLSKPGPDKDYTASGLIGEDKLITAPTLTYDPATPDITRTGDAAKIVASGASAGENYEITYVDGKLTVTSRPSSGGGSSSGRPSTSTGKTDTTTTTKPDGTVTEITTNKDGSTTKTETRPDGSSKTEVKDASGSTGTVKTDKNSQTTAETTLSSKAVEDAKKNGEAVKAPVEVEASRDSNTAPTVKVELPKNAGETEVEIPVSNVKPGTVAVLVHPDGTEEIVKNSLPTEDGIRLTMDGSATVKIMDNSKDFIDTRAHWAKDAIDFVSARGLVNGISDTIYAPNNSTTRAQLWTILARQNDADLTGGSIWYEKAQNWAKDKGVSDGANPNGIINRAQIVTMLWRAIGQPAAASGASFADVPADSYYAQAVAWAIENGITAGVGNGKFDPDAACTRGQIATFLYRYIQHVCWDAQSGRSHCSI